MGQHWFPLHIPGGLRVGQFQGAARLGGAAKGEGGEGEDARGGRLAFPWMGASLYSVLDDGQSALCSPLLSGLALLLHAYRGPH